MSLVNCSECNNQVSDLAEVCPKCGARVSKGARNAVIETKGRSSARLVKALSAVVLVTGVILCAYGLSTTGARSYFGIGFVLSAIGFVGFVVGRFMD